MSTQWEEIPSLLDADDVRSELVRFASMHNPGMSAEEFLDGIRFNIRIGARAGYSIATKLGVRSVTDAAFMIEQPVAVAVPALLCGSTAAGVQVTSVEPSVDGDALDVSGAVPSSPLHHGGTISVRVVAVAGGVEARAQIVYPGQAFAWGAGRRLIRRIERSIAVASESIRQCESVQRHLMAAV